MQRHTVPLTVLVALTSGFAVASLPESAPAVPPSLATAPIDTVRLRPPPAARTRVTDLQAWMAANPGTRGHLVTDRPLYRPGDTIQVKLWSLATRGLTPSEGGAVAVELVDPRGLVSQTEGLVLEGGGADASFVLDAGAPGGSWTVRATLPNGARVERPLVVNTFEAPRIKKTLEYARDGYGPGDTVDAALTLNRATGEPLADVEVVANVAVGGQVLAPIRVRSDSRGEVSLRFVLPTGLTDPDALLTVLVDDGAGVTESISRAIPLALDEVHVGLYPAGGTLIHGLRSRVYFEATDLAGEPVDITARILDDRDRVVASAQSWTDGRGHFELTPEAGRQYRLRVDGHGELVSRDFPLPGPSAEGCVMRHHDDLEGVQTAVRVSVACSSPQDVTVLATQQEQILDRATFHVDRPTTVYLRSGVADLAKARGVARVTVFDASLQPLAERLVFRNKGRALEVQVSADRERYGPGDEVALTLRTTDSEGRPVPAQVAVSVVDDALLAYADDDAHDLSSGLLLQADLPEPIEGAADWFRPDARDGGLAVDLALGTRGWRRFDWTAVDGFEAARRAAELEADLYLRESMDDYGADWGMVAAEGMEVRVALQGAAAAAPRRADAPVPVPATVAKAASQVPRDEKVPLGAAVANEEAGRTYAPSLPEGPARSDFRDTVYWAPQVRTGASGVATVRFALSDAVTSFRATAEGLGAGLVGSGESLLVSTLPFHVDTRLPVALSTGDHLELPVTLANQRPGPLQVGLAAALGDLFELGGFPGALSLASGERRTVWLPVDVRPGRGAAQVRLDARAGALGDGLVREIPVVPRGVPQAWSVSGRLDGAESHAVVIPQSALPGSVSGKLTLMPTPVSEVLTGLEQMVRTPGGCFEQTSSTNWPNVVVLDLLERSGSAGKLAVDRKQVLDTGYGILSRYQVGTGGFETWGTGPGKEALTAYGLLQFTDMDRVYDVDAKLLSDSRNYLLGQRDGSGGYQTTGSSAHGYGTAPPEVLDAYITYALVETGYTDLPREIERSAALARTSRDPYRMGLATLTLLRARPAEGRAAAGRLAGLQASDGGFPGSETSITRSENYNLDVEATALAAMALLRAGDVPRAQRAVGWLHQKQTAAGQWGATQGNALALRAIGELAAAATRGDRPGLLEVRVGGELVHRGTVDPAGRDPVVTDLSRFLSVGTNQVQVTLDGLSVPYALEAGWTTELPTSDAARRVDLVTTLADRSVALGHTTRLTATVTNRTREVVPDPIARIGLPAGLEAQVQQLEAMKKRGEIAFFELRPREVTVYWDGLGVDEVHTVALDLTATAVGRFTGPASAAYPYYDDQAKAWVAGTAVAVTR